MNFKSVSIYLLAAIAALAIGGCAQDSTNTTDDNPEMQEQVMKGTAAEGASAAAGESDTSSTDTTRTVAVGGAAAGGTKVALSADPSGALKYNTDKLNANAGNVTVAFLNESSTPHNVTITGAGSKKLAATKDITKGHETLKVDDLKAGSYTFFCSVPGHEEAGMKGTLTVR
jgi:plastocyanin